MQPCFMRNFYLRLQLVVEKRHGFLPDSVLPFVEIPPSNNRIPMELLQNYFSWSTFLYSFIWGFSFVDTSKLCGYRCPLLVFQQFKI